MNYIVDHIPVWVYVVVGCAGAGALMYFFSPIILPLWAKLPTWLKVTLGFIVAMFLAVMGGRVKGRRDAEEEQRQRDAAAIANRKTIDNEVDKMDRPTINTKLDPWMRDDPG